MRHITLTLKPANALKTFDQNKDPSFYNELLAKAKEIGFDMPSDRLVGKLLKTLIVSKPKGHFLELGTGIGLSLCWMAAGLDVKSTLTTIDKDEQLIEDCKGFF